jgi:hypothetical protein
MSVYPNQTNSTPGDSFFSFVGSIGTSSNWSQYPAISTITYSGAGGIANFTTLNALTAVSTPNLLVSTINNEVYPPSAPIFGTFPFREGDSSATVTALGCTPESVVLITQFGSDTSNPIVNISASTNSYYVALSSPATSNYYLNWVAFTAR